MKLGKKGMAWGLEERRGRSEIWGSQGNSGVSCVEWGVRGCWEGKGSNQSVEMCQVPLYFF